MDWINFGWGPKLSKSFSSSENYHIDFTNANYSSRKISDVCIDAINNICNQYPPPYNLMVSGGIDSQAMIWCWKQTSVPFEIVTIRYIDQHGTVLNSHDIDNITKFSLLYDIKPQYIDFDIINFLENNLLDYAIKYQCTSPQITTYMCMSEMINNGTIVFSGDFLPYAATYSYTIFGLKRYADTTKRNIIPFFLLYDSELSTILTRYTNTHEDMLTNDAYHIKVNAMKKIGIPIIPQERKFSGFEKVKELYDARFDLVSVKDRLKYSSMPSKRIFDIVFRYKISEVVQYKDKIIWLL